MDVIVRFFYAPYCVCVFFHVWGCTWTCVCMWVWLKRTTWGIFLRSHLILVFWDTVSQEPRTRFTARLHCLATEPQHLPFYLLFPRTKTTTSMCLYIRSFIFKHMSWGLNSSPRDCKLSPSSVWESPFSLLFPSCSSLEVPSPLWYRTYSPALFLELILFLALGATYIPCIYAHLQKLKSRPYQSGSILICRVYKGSKSDGSVGEGACF